MGLTRLVPIVVIVASVVVIASGASGVSVRAPVLALIPLALNHNAAIFGTGEATASVTPSLLRVTTNPAVPGKILVDGVPRDEWGLAWMKIAPGTHTVSFGGLNGLATPASQTVTTTAGATTTVQGNYATLGFLRVITNPPVASTISVNGMPRDDWGMWTALAPGTYTVHFGAVAGYNPPPDQSAAVTAGMTTTITGNFLSNPSALGPDPATYGLLRVTTNPATAIQVLVNGIPMDDWGLAWVKLAPGTYTVSFGGAYGVTPPAPQTITVTATQTTTYDAAFIVHGSLRILTSPSLGATVSVDGVPRDDWGMWQSMPPGTYNVSFENLSGMTMPTAQVVTVGAGALTQATGEYAAAEASSNWAGYVVASDFTTPQPVVTAVRGSWIVPTIQPTSDMEASAVWVGIGGAFDMSLIQTGTEADSGSGSTFYAAWYELLPAFEVRITNQMATCPVLPTTNYCLVKPGDAILAAVSLMDPTGNLWTITLSDTTQGWTFGKDFTYTSSEASAEWIVERPESCGPSGCSLTTLASFSNIYLGQDASNLVDTNSATLAGYHGTIGAFVRRVVQMYSGPKLLAQPSDLTPDATSFSVTKAA